MLHLPPIDLKGVPQKLATHFRPWQCSFQFWVRAVDIYTGYKRVSLVKDAKKQEEMWERQHEFAAEKIYAMCSDLGSFFLKTGFFHADPHPGNILICTGSEVALLDYGQVKDLPDELRLGNGMASNSDFKPFGAGTMYYTGERFAFRFNQLL